MIVGSGIDLCEIHRIRKAVESPHGERFVARVFTPGEVAYATRKANVYQRYAARFAAKEAAMKALGTGWHGVSWRDFEVVNLPGGRPTLVLHGKAAEIATQKSVRHIALSLTHTDEQAMAMVIFED